MKRNAILLGIDPGFSSLGWAALCIAPPPSEAMRCNDLGIIATEKASKKAHVLATEDNLRRAREIANCLNALVTRFEDDKNAVLAFCTESMSWPRNAAVTAKMGITWGVLAAVSHQRRVPIFQCSPQELKKQTAGTKSATKEEVEAAVVARLGPSASAMIVAIPKTKREHPVDALAAAIVCSRAEAVQAARRAMT